MSIQTLLIHQNFEEKVDELRSLPMTVRDDKSQHFNAATTPCSNSQTVHSFTEGEGFRTFEEAILKKMKAEKIRAELFVTLLSYLARIPRTAKSAILSHETVREYFSIIEPNLELTLPTNRSLIQGGETDQNIRRLQKVWFNHLKCSMVQFWANETTRTMSSWRAEIAAVIVASYPDQSKIPNKVWKELKAVFGTEVLQSDEFREIKKGITTKTAGNWIKNHEPFRDIFKYANLQRSNVLALVA